MNGICTGVSLTDTKLSTSETRNNNCNANGILTAPSVDFQTSLRLASGPVPSPITPADVYPPSRYKEPRCETTWCLRRPHQPASPFWDIVDHRTAGMMKIFSSLPVGVFVDFLLRQSPSGVQDSHHSSYVSGCISSEESVRPSYDNYVVF